MVDLLFTITLFCVFAISALSVILIGANVYQSVTEKASATYGTRTILSYIAQKVQSADNGYPAEIKHFEGIDALTLYQEYNGELYTTYIYEDQASLKELFTRADAAFNPEAGSIIMGTSQFEMNEMSGGILYLQVKGADGQPSGIYLRPKSEGRDPS